MKSIFSALRQLPAVNLPVRLFIKKGQDLFGKLVQRWPVSGTVTARYGDTRFKVYNRCDDAFVQYFYYNLEYHEAPVLLVTDAFAQRCRTILDIGANTGIDAIIVARNNPHITIHALEPYGVNFNRLQKNIEINGQANVRAYKIALGEQEGEIRFHVPVNDRITDVSSAVEGVGEKVYGRQLAWKTVPVAQTTLDQLAPQIGPVDFFKCDVEGFEINVFRGASSFFRQQQPAFIVEIHLTEESISFFKEFAREHHYTIYYLTAEGLVKLNELYLIGWKGDFLFTRYDHPYTFIPNAQVDLFVEAAVAVQNKHRQGE